jgi:single-stranded-DNA-specific exonuclease
LTVADFEPTLNIDAELRLSNVTPELFKALSLLQPFGSGNYEPVFAARNVRLMAPPQIMKEKHVRLKLAWNGEESAAQSTLLTPRCHPDSAAIPRRSENWRKSVVYKALGWRLAERVQQAQLLPGDVIDIAFTLDYNDHPDFGGLELSLKDFTPHRKAVPETTAEPTESALSRG